MTKKDIHKYVLEDNLAIQCLNWKSGLSLWENELPIALWLEIQLQDIHHPAHSSDTRQMQTSFVGRTVF